MVGIDSLNLFGKVTLLLGRSTVKVVSLLLRFQYISASRSYR